jgi:hypothetical protein
MTSRRGFLGAILAAAAAPAIVRAESLMKIYVPPQELAYETLAYRQAAAMGRAMQQTKAQIMYDMNSYWFIRNGSLILTRQQIMDDLLRIANDCFAAEYGRINIGLNK